MMRYFFLSFLRTIGILSSVSALTLILTLFFVPRLSLSLGNVFFGGIDSLYHVRVAQVLFQLASYPPLFPHQPVSFAHYQLSRTYFIEGDYYSALDEAREELRVFPDHSNTYYIIGLTYGYLNRSYEAIDAFSSYIEAHPSSWAGRNDKAWLQFRLGDIDGALATIEPVVHQFPYTPWVQNTYCALLLNKGQLGEAEQACQNAEQSLKKMTGHDWGRAYPGNDPSIYNAGFEQMKKSVQENLNILDKKRGDTSSKSSEISVH